MSLSLAHKRRDQVSDRGYSGEIFSRLGEQHDVSGLWIGRGIGQGTGNTSPPIGRCIEILQPERRALDVPEVVIHYTTLHYTTRYYTTLHYTILHYTTPHYTTLHYTTLHYTTRTQNHALADWGLLLLEPNNYCCTYWYPISFLILLFARYLHVN